MGIQIHVNNGAELDHQMRKEVAKPAAFQQLSDMHRAEETKATSPWYRSRVDVAEARKNARMYEKNLARVSPETLSAAAKDAMWRRAKQLKDEFVVGMLSHEELHPVKQFTQNGTTVCVIDEERMRALDSVRRNTEWTRANEAKVREFKNIMRHLCPENPNAGDIERFRPRKAGLR